MRIKFITDYDEVVGIEYSANHFVFSDGIERNPCNAGDN